MLALLILLTRSPNYLHEQLHIKSSGVLSLADINADLVASDTLRVENEENIYTEELIVVNSCCPE